MFADPAGRRTGDPCPGGWPAWTGGRAGTRLAVVAHRGVPPLRVVVFPDVLKHRIVVGLVGKKIQEVLPWEGCINRTCRKRHGSRAGDNFRSSLTTKAQPLLLDGGIPRLLAAHRGCIVLRKENWRAGSYCASFGNAMPAAWNTGRACCNPCNGTSSHAAGGRRIERTTCSAYLNPNTGGNTTTTTHAHTA